MVCKVFCHILKERLATVVEEYNLVVEEQGGFRQENGSLAAFIDFSKAYDRACREKL